MSERWHLEGASLLQQAQRARRNRKKKKNKKKEHREMSHAFCGKIKTMSHAIR